MAPSIPGEHTQAEIHSQPQTWQTTLEDLSRMSVGALPDLREYDHVLFTGCGSTHYLSQWAARQSQEITGRAACAAPASEIFLFPVAWLPKDRRTLLVAVSRSGETTETVRAVESFRAGGHGDTLAITCYPEGRLGRVAHWIVGTPAGKEKSIAQTRSFTNMMLAVAWLLRSDDSVDPSQVLVVRARQLLEKYKELAARFGRDFQLERFFFLGNGALYGLANEAMLKMKEMSLSYAEGYHFLEFRHGPMSMVGANSLVLGLLSHFGRDQELTVLKDMRQLGAHTLALVDEASPDIAEAVDDVVELGTGLPSVWRSPLYLPFLQMLAYQRALAKHLDPDRPTHLEAVVRLDND